MWEKVVLPPLPRYLFNGCCDAPGCCEGVGETGLALDLLQKSLTVRRQLRDYLTATYPNLLVPEVYDLMFPEASSPGKIMDSLRDISDPDGVHLTREGYRLWVKAVVSFTELKYVQKSSEKTGKSKLFFWRGFLSPAGTDRPTNQAAVHQNRTAGGGKWAPGKQAERGRGETRGTRGGHVGWTSRAGYNNRGGKGGRGHPYRRNLY